MATIEHKRNDTFELDVTYTSASVPVDITGYPTIRAHFRKGNGLIQSVSVGSGITITNATAGEFTIKFATTNFPVAELNWDIEFTDPSGNIKSTKTQILKIVEDITRD